MKQNSKLKNTLFQISAILILVAAVVYSFRPSIAGYIMIAGAIGYIAITLTTPYRGKSFRGKRLFTMQALAALLICVSAYLMFTGTNGWVVVLLIAAILILYSTIAMSMEYKKEQEEDNRHEE
jgi:phosphatidylglycerophosphate synthase